MGTVLVGVVVFGGAALIGRSLWRQHSMAKDMDGTMCSGCAGCADYAAKNKK